MGDERPWRQAPRPPRRGPLLVGAGSIVAIVVCALLALGGRLFLRARERGAREQAVGVAGTRLTLAGGPDEALAGEASRDERPDLYYHVTLTSAPVGDRLILHCDWVGPSGQTARQNQYETKPITTDRWKTHCHQRFGPEAEAGQWTVRMAMGGRTLCSDSFTLR